MTAQPKMATLTSVQKSTCFSIRSANHTPSYTALVYWLSSLAYHGLRTNYPLLLTSTSLFVLLIFPFNFTYEMLLLLLLLLLLFLITIMVRTCVHAMHLSYHWLHSAVIARLSWYDIPWFQRQRPAKDVDKIKPEIKPFWPKRWWRSVLRIPRIVIVCSTPHFVSTQSIFSSVGLQNFLPNFAVFAVKSPSLTQRSISQENA